MRYARALTRAAPQLKVQQCCLPPSARSWRSASAECAALHVPTRRGAAQVAAGYVAVTVAICRGDIAHTELFHEAFPTGRARGMSLTPLDIMLYIGLPGLYPLPLLPTMAMRKTWGCVPAIFVTVLALPVGFCGHALERLVVDMHCQPTSWFLQPTAMLHWGAGLAIMGGYIQTHALNDAVAT